jgi:signal peptidase I
MGTEVETPAPPHWWQVVLVGRKPRRTLVRILVLVVVCTILFRFVLQPIRVEGVSMLPTFSENRVNCVNCLAYLFHEPRRGDIVSIKLAGKHLMYCKRIVGLPGETISFHQGHAYINGELLPEPYVKYPCRWEIPPEQIGPDEYFVVGDNRSMFHRDHEKGKAQRERILGKVMF